MTPRAVLWLAVVLAEVGAFVLAVRWVRGSLGSSNASGVRPKAPGPSFPKRERGAASFLWPIVVLLACAVVIDLAVGLHDPPSSWGLAALAAAGPRPRVGLARAAYHLADGLVMAWPGLLAATCGRVFGPQKPNGPHSRKSEGRSGPQVRGRFVERSQAGSSPMHADPWLPSPDTMPASDLNVNGSPRTRGAETARKPADAGSDPQESPRFAWSYFDVLAGCYLGAVVGLACLYPLGHARTQALLLAWEAVALAFAAGAIFAGWRRVVAGGPSWTRAHGVLLVLVPVEAAVAVIGPFAREDVFSAWDVARWQYLLGFAVVAGLLAWPSRRRYAPETAQPAQDHPRG